MKKLSLFLALCSSALAQPRLWPETTDPSAPSAGFQITYAKANLGLCSLDSNSTLKCMIVASGANAAKADTLTTTRAIYGNNFDGSAALTQIIASTYGGTGNGFAKFTGPASSEKAFILPNADATILTTNALVTVAQGGFGLATLTIHALYVGNGTTAPNAVGLGTTTQVLHGNASGDPTFTAIVNADITNSTIDLTAKVTGTLPLAQGGLGIATAPARVVYIPVAGCNNATAGASLDLPTANAPTPTCHGTTTTSGTLDYGNGANQTAAFEIVLPAGWTGNEDITLDWYTASTSVSGKWTIETSCKAADGDMVTSPTYNSTQTITTTSSGTANGLTRSTQTAVTTTGCSAGNIQILRIGRDITDSSTVTHSLLGIELTLRITPQT